MTCATGKLTYATAAKAWRQVGIMRRKWHTHQACAYRCPKCKQYHLTHDMGYDERTFKSRQGKAA